MAVFMSPRTYQAPVSTCSVAARLYHPSSVKMSRDQLRSAGKSAVRLMKRTTTSTATSRSSNGVRRDVIWYPEPEDLTTLVAATRYTGVPLHVREPAGAGTGRSFRGRSHGRSQS